MMVPHRKSIGLSACVGLAAVLALSCPAQARITKIVIDTKVSPAFSGQSFGNAGTYETIAGHAYGEIDPNDPHNSIINDIEYAPLDNNGKVTYMTTFFIVKPVDLHQEQPLHVAGRPEPGRPLQYRRTDQRRHWVERRLAGRQRGRHRANPAAQQHQRLRRSAGGNRPGWHGHHGQGSGAHPQPERPQLAANPGDVESRALQAGDPRHHPGRSGNAHAREHIG